MGEAAAGDAEVHASPTPLHFPDYTREHSTLATSCTGDHAVYTRPSLLIDPLSTGLPGLGTVARPAVSSLIKPPFQNPIPPFPDSLTRTSAEMDLARGPSADAPRSCRSFPPRLHDSNLPLTPAQEHGHLDSDSDAAIDNATDEKAQQHAHTTRLVS